MAMLVTERAIKARLDFHKRLLRRHTQQALAETLGGRPSRGKRYMDLTHHDLAMVQKYEEELREFQRGGADHSPEH